MFGTLSGLVQGMSRTWETGDLGSGGSWHLGFWGSEIPYPAKNCQGQNKIRQSALLQVAAAVKAKILSTGPKYTAYLIMLIPVAAIIVVILINKNIIDILFSSFGIISLVYVVSSNAIGIFLINRLLNYQNESRLIK